MTIIEALKTGRTFTRFQTDGTMIRILGGITQDCVIHDLSVEDILADNWEVEEPRVTITYSDLRRAYEKCTREGMTTMRDLAKELGL